MQLKILALALTLALGLNQVTLGQTAGEQNSRKSVKRPVASAPVEPANSENLLARTVFQALVGEFALQRGDTGLSADAWADLAQRTQDPKVIGRATEVAGFARQYDRALELSRQWIAADPESAKARQTQSMLLVLSNRLDELAPQLITLLEQDKPNVGHNLMHLNRMLARVTDKKAVQRLIDRIATPYEGLAEAHFAMAQAAAAASDNLRALNETEKTLLLRPDWEVAANARAQLQAQQSAQTAIDSLSGFVGRNPAAKDARLTLARLLVAEKRYDEARPHFDRLIQDNPDNPDVIYPVAMLALQQGDANTGRTQLERLLNTEFQDKSTVHFFLGQLDQEQRKFDTALDHYRQITAGDQYLTARTQSARILAQQGKHEAALALLRDTRGRNGAERTQLTLSEAQVLREANRYNDAFVLLDNALSAQPDNTDFLYESALMAERTGKQDIFDTRIQRLLSIKPEHAHALNALGYSYAERNIRLKEAEELIGKALRIQPGDAFITDSLGWVFFRQGRLNEALETLEKAYRIKPDPEIAAHLGEVLWSLNRKDDARRILREAAKSHPENEVLAGTIKKLIP